MQCKLNCWHCMTVHSRVVSVLFACARNLTRMRTRGDRQDCSTRSGGCYRSGARMNHGASEITVTFSAIAPDAHPCRPIRWPGTTPYIELFPWNV